MRAPVGNPAERFCPDLLLTELGLDRGSLPFEQNGPKEDIDDLRVVVRICPL